LRELFEDVIEGFEDIDPNFANVPLLNVTSSLYSPPDPPVSCLCTLRYEYLGFLDIGMSLSFAFVITILGEVSEYLANPSLPLSFEIPDENFLVS